MRLMVSMFSKNRNVAIWPQRSSIATKIVDLIVYSIHVQLYM